MQLVINTFGASLRRDGERFVVKAGEKKLEVSAHKVRSILITTGAHLSTDVLQLAVDNNIEVVFLNKYGDPYARVWQAKMGSTAAIRRRQIEVAESPEGFRLVRDWVTAKLRNQADFLDELWRRRPGKDDLFDAPVKSDSKRKRNLKQRDVIQTEAHSRANRLPGREDLPRIVETEAVWGEE